ncbi:MAG: TldD/PmbA family protein [Candidatus Hodarchaeota archaeon]
MKLSKDLLFEKAAVALTEAEKLGATQAEVTVTLQQSALTRLANSIIDQNVSENRAAVRIRTFLGKQKGSIQVNALDDGIVKEAVESSIKYAKISPEDKDFKSLIEPKPPKTDLDFSKILCNATAEASPEDRADYAMKAVNVAHSVDKRISVVAGAISNTFAERVVCNSFGVEAYQALTLGEIDLTVLARDGEEETAGWASDYKRDFRKLRIDTVAEIAAQKAANGFGVKSVEPGEYEIILEPAALGGLMFFIAYFGFSAVMYQDYRSFLRDRIGEKIFSSNLTFWDDGLDDRFPGPQVFDSEGYPKSRLNLVEKGVVKNLVYDSYTAGKDGVESTGHSWRGWGRSMPFPTHVVVQEGDSNMEEMIAETKRGILVTHFHYQNPVDPTKGVLTGLTRDGTWLVENGEISHPVGTLRYTDAVPRFLSQIDLIGKYPELKQEERITPPIKLPSFRISGSNKKS